MAQNEQDREDLMREAVALPMRTELACADFESPITLGFRANSGMSIFFGQDPVYHFDPEGRLRRAYVDGFLYRSQHTTLARLQRNRTSTQTQLLRTDLKHESLMEFCSQMREALESLFQNLVSGRFRTVRCIPEADDLIPQIMSALSRIQVATPWLSTAINRRQ